MNVFSLHLQSSTQYERVERVLGFIGEDASGALGLLPRAERMMTCLEFGLARFRYLGADEQEVTEYLAMPGAVLYFVKNELFLSTRTYVRSTRYETIAAALDERLKEEEESVQAIKKSLHRLDEEVLRRLLDLKPLGGA